VPDFLRNHLKTRLEDILSQKIENEDSQSRPKNEFHITDLLAVKDADFDKGSSTVVAGSSVQINGSHHDSTLP